MTAAQLRPGVRGGGRKPWNGSTKGHGKPKLFRSGVPGISDDTFNKGSAEAAAQFDKSKQAMERYARKEFTEGEAIAEEIRTGVKPDIPLPPYLPARPTAPTAPADPNDAAAAEAHAAAMAQHAIAEQESTTTWRRCGRHESRAWPSVARSKRRTAAEPSP